MTAPAKSGRPKEALATRFWRGIEVTEGCWLWRKARGSHGYGVIGVGPHQTMTTHRVSWLLHHGPIPSGMMVLHHCDTPACVRPEHLYLGDAKANARDLWERGHPVANIATVWTDPALQRKRIAHLARGAAHWRHARAASA